MSSSETDVAVVGAGPYGLSVSAYLSATGVEHRTFGQPMQTWKAMPKGMCLKSLDFATNIYSPRKGYSLIEYARGHGLSHGEPLTGELFCSYGLWAQQQLVPHLEQVDVTRLAHPGRHFEIALSNGDKLTARRVVVATGLRYFAYLPDVFRGLPRELATHTSDHTQYDSYRDKDVVVVGAGQSAIEAAVMLQEAGARTQLLTRCGGASFASPPPAKRRLRHRILHPMSVLGPSRTGFFLENVPRGFHYLPDAKRVELTRKLYGPWGAWWIASRFEGKVRGVPNTDIVSATPSGGRLALRLRDRNDKSERDLVVDHVVAGTGYEPDVDTLPFLDSALASRIRRIERSPRLSANFESSVEGLYFVGAAAAFSFGPLLRFVAGAEFSAPVVARHLARNRARRTDAAAATVSA
jgi:cation diffusion facilitator CzcD-associated flavoprotein CzcO